jgi:DNA-binding CsgD family transcriptional regulator
VLDLIVDGLAKKEIANHAGLSYHKFDARLRHIHAKLQLGVSR